MAQSPSPETPGPPGGAAPSADVSDAVPTQSSIAAAMGGGSPPVPSQSPGPPPAPTVDVEGIESVASRLLPLASDARDAAASMMRHAPDPGAAPAPDAVVDVQGTAMDALGALSAALEESSALLVLSARRYRETEDEVARSLGRVGEDRG